MRVSLDHVAFILPIGYKRSRAHINSTPTVPPPTNEVDLHEGFYMRKSLMLPCKLQSLYEEVPHGPLQHDTYT